MLGPNIVEHLEGSPQAKDRLRAILQALCGQIGIPEACQELGIAPTRFHEMRNGVLQTALEALEPRPRGRPPHRRLPQDDHVEDLEHQVWSLKADLQAAQIRQELSVLMPRAERPSDPKPDGGKKSGQRRRSRRRVAPGSP